MQEAGRSIYGNETVYRPIVEQESALLEVGEGCSWRKCTFCDFARDPYRMVPLDEVLHNLEVLAEREWQRSSLFLLGQNALCRKTSDLVEILTAVRERMPNIEQVSMYARADDILRKGPQDLLKLRELGLVSVHVGLESGSDQVLRRVHKGVTSAQFLQAFTLLHKADILYHVSYILGLGGQALWRDHAARTAWLLNHLSPLSIWALNLKLWENTPLYDEAQLGRFRPLLPEQMLMEQRLIVEQLDVPHCLYMDTTALGQYTLYGTLPEGKQELLRAMDGLLKPYDLTSFMH